MGHQAGFSTTEGLVAITLLSIAALGAAGTLALSIKVLGSAERATDIARLTDEAVEALHTRLKAGGGRCSSVVPDSARGPGGVVVHWSVVTLAGAIDVSLVSPRAITSPAGSDTLRLSLPCQ